MRTLALVLSTTLLAASPVAAQDAPAAPDDEDARAHFDSGNLYYRRGEYESAAREFEAALRLSGRPELRYNLYLSYERLARFEDAADALERYLAEGRDVADRELLEVRLRNLRERVAEGAAATPDEPVAPPLEPAAAPVAAPASAEVSPVLVAGLVVTGVGAIGLGVLGGLALAEDGALAASCNTTCSDEELATLQTLTISADVSLGVLGAGAVLAVIGLVLTLNSSGEPGPRATAWMTGTGAGVAVEGPTPW